MTRSGRSRTAWRRSLVSGIAATLATWGACFLFLPPLSAASPSGWIFLPTGKDSKADYSRLEVDESKWHPCEFPHQDWEKLQPQNNVFGWYRHRFTIPVHLRGRDLWLDLGLIDDVDACFVNGKPVGQSGEFPPKFRSAWTVERLYRIPVEILNPEGDNVIAVKVYDAGGVGGMMCRPVLGAALVPHGTPWRFRACGQDGSTDFSAADIDDSTWNQVQMPDRRDNWPLTLEDWPKAAKPTKGWDARQAEDNVYGWYRLRFSVPADWQGKDVFLNLGKIYDVDATYLNGRPVGATGRFPPDAVSEDGKARVYRLGARTLNYGGNNVLAVKVFDAEGMGGIIDVPTVSLTSHGLNLDGGTLTPDSLSDAVDQLRFQKALGQAESLLGRVLEEQSTNRALCSRALSELAVVYQEMGKRDEAIHAFNRLNAEYPEQSCRGGTIQSLFDIQRQRVLLSTVAMALDEDRRTQGDWRGAYGNSEFVLCSMWVPMGTCHDIWSGSPLRAYPTTAESPDEEKLKTKGQKGPWSYGKFTGRAFEQPPDAKTYEWVMAERTKDKRALWNPILGERTCAVWDDQGEAHPFDNGGPDLWVHLSVPSGAWILSLYLVDWDWGMTSRPRLLSVALLDERDRRLLALSPPSSVARGRYVRFLLRGERDVLVRVYKHRSPCAILSALFMDPVPRSGPGKFPPTAWMDTSRSEGERLCRKLQRLSDEDSSEPAKLFTVARWKRWQELAEEVKAWSGPVGKPNPLGTWIAWQCSAGLLASPALRMARLRDFLSDLREKTGDQGSEARFAADLAEWLMAENWRRAEAQLLSTQCTQLAAGAFLNGQSDEKLMALVEAQWEAWRNCDPPVAASLFGTYLARLFDSRPVRGAVLQHVSALGIKYLDLDVSPDGRIVLRWWQRNAWEEVEVAALPATTFRSLVVDALQNSGIPPEAARKDCPALIRALCRDLDWAVPWAWKSVRERYPDSRVREWAFLAKAVPPVGAEFDKANYAWLRALYARKEYRAFRAGAHQYLAQKPQKGAMLGFRADLWRLLANSYLRNDDPEGALKTWQHALHESLSYDEIIARASNPSIKSAFLGLCETAGYLGRKGEARALANTLLTHLSRVQGSEQLAEEVTRILEEMERQ